MPTDEALHSSSGHQMANNNLEGTNKDVFPPNYASNGHRSETSHQAQNQLIRIFRFTQPVIRGWNSTTLDPQSEIHPLFSSEPFHDSKIIEPNVIFDPLRAKDGPNFDTEKSTLGLSDSASTTEFFKSNDEYYPSLSKSSVSYYPNFSEIPTTKFSCDSQKHSGYFADVETHCQVFHICSNGFKYDFLCPNETVFDQRHFLCIPRDAFDCNSAESLYDLKENRLDEDEAGSLIAHAAGATGARGPGAIYNPLARIFAATPAYADSPSESREPIGSSNQSTEASSYLGVGEESANDGDPSSRAGHSSPTNGVALSTDNRSAPLATKFNSSDSAHKLSLSTTAPEPTEDTSFFSSTSRLPIGSEVLFNSEPVFSLHGHLITYGSPFEPEKSHNFRRFYEQYEPPSDSKLFSGLQKPDTPYELFSQLEGPTN